MKTTFGIYGSGWRSEFFMRVAKLLPTQFTVDGVITTDPSKAERFQKLFGLKSYPDLYDYLKSNKPDFIVDAVTKSASFNVTMNILKKGIPVLMETPAGSNLSVLHKLHKEMPQNAKIQIAEQYPFHPLHQARLNIINSGKLGDVQHVQVSFTHEFHALALIRRFLGIGFENASIRAMSFPIDVISGFSRGGAPRNEIVYIQTQMIAFLRFGEKGERTALYNFEENQHRSWVRTPIIQIKGSHGEIFNETLKYMADYKTPVEAPLTRVNMGENQNVEGYGLKGIQAAGEWYYKNPYMDSRLTDDEIAVAVCLEKMATYVQTGEPFYSFTEAAHDAYLSTMIGKAISEDATIKTQTMPWVKFPRDIMEKN
ncbi:MAG: Gfo/Idh/MocA family oxidoreductase [Defluviitaleaceae bacterium]|nr:Gfo/Idh/MocA family oxidoreductase [Defluviitaleaceae bacterium]